MNAVEICQRNADRAAANIAKTAEENRKAMPICAQIVDGHRALFGEVKMLWADEGGKRMGNANWWKRVGCLFDYSPDNRMVPATDIVFSMREK